MKNDEEFIAGIYRRAEERKKEEDRKRGRGHHVRAWQAFGVAACLCLIVSGAAYAGRRKETPKGTVPEDGAVMALSVDDAGIPAAEGKPDARVRTSGNEGRQVDEVVGADGSPDGRIYVDAVRQQEKEAVLEALWAGYEFAHFIRGQVPAKEGGIKTQEAGGN